MSKQHFKDRIESLSEIRYEISMLLIDQLGLRAQAHLLGVEQSTTLAELRSALFLLKEEMVKEGKQEIARDLLALWKKKTGY